MLKPFRKIVTAPRLGSAFLCAWPYVLFAVFAILCLPAGFFGDRYVSVDHPTQMANAFFSVESLRNGFGLHGWSHSWFAGYPTGYFYPLGGSLLVLAIRAISANWLTLDAAYGLAICFALFLRGASVYYLASRICNRQWVAFLAAAMAMTDYGGIHADGWYYAIFMGVWPQHLAISFAVLAMALLPKALCKQATWRSTFLFALTMSAAILSHPTLLVFFAFAMPILILFERSMRKDGDWRPQMRAVLAGCLALGVCAFWLLPFLTFNGAEAQGVSSGYRASNSGAQNNLELLWSGAMFTVIPPFILVAGFLGSVLLAFERHFIARSLLLVGMVLLTLRVNGLVDFYQLSFFEPFFKRVLFPRFSAILRPFIFVCAAFFIFKCYEFIKRKFKEEFAAKGSSAHYFLAGATLLFALMFIGDAYDLVDKRRQGFLAADPFRLTMSPYIDEMHEVLSFLEDQKSEDDGLFRIVWTGSGTALHDHWPYYSTIPYFKTGFTPASHFQFKFASSNEKVWQRLGAKYVLAQNRDRRVPEQAVELLKLTHFSLYELNARNVSPLTLGDVEVPVEDLEWENYKISFNVPVGFTGDGILAMSYFSRWQASIDGQAVSLGAQQLDGVAQSGFVTIPVRPGRYELLFSWHWQEYLGYTLTILVLLGMAMVAAWESWYLRRLN